MSSAARIRTLDRRRPPLVDPRGGDVETDESSPERRSLLAIAGNLLVEVSLPKMALALGMLIVLPAVLLGLAPIVATIWVRKVSSTPAGSVGALVFIAVLVALAWFGGRSLFRVVERSFWSLNAMAIQPGYVAWRELLLHLSSRLTGAAASETTRARGRAAASAVSGVIICALALVVLRLVWPATHWVGTLSDFRTPHWLLLTALANATAVAAAYLAIAALVWGIADATMPQPRELDAFHAPQEFVRSWRVAHLSDIHVVGERYGFRLGSGRAGPRGNDNLGAALERLIAANRSTPSSSPETSPTPVRPPSGVSCSTCSAIFRASNRSSSRCRGITTSTSSTARIRRVSICRRARRSAFGKCARSRRWRRCRERMFASSTPRKAAWASRSTVRLRRAQRTSSDSPTADRAGSAR
jgi:hypothetical protein